MQPVHVTTADQFAAVLADPLPEFGPDLERLTARILAERRAEDSARLAATLAALGDDAGQWGEPDGLGHWLKLIAADVWRRLYHEVTGHEWH